MNIVDIIKKKIEIAEEIDALNSNSEEHIACEKALVQYLQEVDDWELFTMEDSTGHYLAEIAGTYGYNTFLIAALNKYPQLATFTNNQNEIFLFHCNPSKHKFINVVDRLIDKYPESIKIQNLRGQTFCHYFASQNVFEVCRLAFAKNPDCVLIQDAHGRTFIHCLVPSPEVSYLGDNKVSICNMFVLRPKLAEIADEDGNTIGHLAAERGEKEICLKILKVNPESANIPNKHGLTFIDYAKTKKENDIVIAHKKALMPDMKALLNERKANIEKTK